MPIWIWYMFGSCVAAFLIGYIAAMLMDNENLR